MAARRNPATKPKGGAYRISRGGTDAGHHHHAAVEAYFDARLEALDVVATTETRSGQTLDWVPVGSQAPGDVAALPPLPPQTLARAADPGRPTATARFELRHDAAARGPVGTVPVLRKDLSAITVDEPLHRYLSKGPGPGQRDSPPHAVAAVAAAADVAGGGHRYAASSHHGVSFGAEGWLSLNAPWTETSADFSLAQLWVANDAQDPVQSVEAGIQVMQNLYGDWAPHLFVYYTTCGYASSGDNQGGYNRDVNGWVQVDGAVFPGGAFSGVSTPGGDQYDLYLKFQLVDGNWWLRVGDSWAGYYPGSLFEGNRSPSGSLGDHADRVAFGAEVYDSEAVAGMTSTDMGSGQWADAQWPWAAYQRNLMVQVDSAGTMDDFDADGLSVDSPSMYGLETHLRSGEGWGSYQWLGGPGAG